MPLSIHRYVPCHHNAQQWSTQSRYGRIDRHTRHILVTSICTHKGVTVSKLSEHTNKPTNIQHQNVLGFLQPPLLLQLPLSLSVTWCAFSRHTSSISLCCSLQQGHHRIAQHSTQRKQTTPHTLLPLIDEQHKAAQQQDSCALGTHQAATHCPAQHTQSNTQLREGLLPTLVAVCAHVLLA